MFGPVAAVPSQPTGAQSALGGLDSTAFLELLTAQLRFQNPLSPTDTDTMMQQTAAFAQVERLQEIAQAQQQLLGTQLATVAGDLIGREITAQLPDGTTVSGVVDSVRYTADGPVLSVGDDEVGVAHLTTVSSAAPAQSSTPASA